MTEITPDSLDTGHVCVQDKEQSGTAGKILWMSFRYNTVQCRIGADTRSHNYRAVISLRA